MAKNIFMDWDAVSDKFRKTLGMEYEYLIDFYKSLNKLVVLKEDKPEEVKDKPQKPKVKLPAKVATSAEAKERETDRIMRMHGINVNNTTPEQREEMSKFYGQFVGKTPEEIAKVVADTIANDKNHKLNPNVIDAISAANTAYDPHSKVGGKQSDSAMESFLKVFGEKGSDKDKGRRLMIDIIPTEHMKAVYDMAKSANPDMKNESFIMPYKSRLHTMGTDGLVIFACQQMYSQINLNDMAMSMSTESTPDIIKSVRRNVNNIKHTYDEAYKDNGRDRKELGKEANEALKDSIDLMHDINDEVYNQEVEESVKQAEFDEKMARATKRMSEQKRKDYIHDEKERAKLADTKQRLREAREAKMGANISTPEDEIQEAIDADRYDLGEIQTKIKNKESMDFLKAKDLVDDMGPTEITPFNTAQPKADQKLVRGMKADAFRFNDELLNGKPEHKVELKPTSASPKREEKEEETPEM